MTDSDDKNTDREAEGSGSTWLSAHLAMTLPLVIFGIASVVLYFMIQRYTNPKPVQNQQSSTESSNSSGVSQNDTPASESEAENGPDSENEPENNVSGS